MAIVTPTDRPMSVRNCCVIEVFGGAFVLSRCVLDFSVGVVLLSYGWGRSLPFFFNYLLCVTAGGPVSPREHESFP